MEWLSDLLKHITSSRSLTVAVFVTSASLLFGPKWLPEFLGPLPDKWITPATGALVFSGVLLFFWLIPAAWNVGVIVVRWIARCLYSKNLTDHEQVLMLMLAELADESLNLRTLDYKNSELSKLEVLELSSCLSRKGLVNINQYDENLIALSSGGRQRVLEIKAKLRA
jgi:hypothetical protein